MWAVIGLLAALLALKESGEGQTVSTSLYETGLAWMTIPLAGYAASGEVRRPYGSGIAEIVPYQAFEVTDGWLMIGAGNDNLFRRLCGALGLDALACNPAFATNAARVTNRDRLIPQIGAAVRGYSAEALGKMLDEAGVPNAPLLNADQVATHPQTQALEMIARCEDGGIELTGIPLTFDDVRPRASTPAPGLGQHNATLRTFTSKGTTHAE
jgi:crotonobetainyl-CoA:carnitine CoA-transferase CaiB-like acyl-CoA transferase